MLYFAVASILAVSAVEVELQRLDGETLNGTMIGLSNEMISLSSEDGDQVLPVRSVLSVTPTERPNRSTMKPDVWVELIDGSRLLGASYEVTGQEARIEVIGAGLLEIPTQSIESVRLKSHENLPSLRQQWLEIKESQREGDIIVVRKESQQQVEDGNRVSVKTVWALDSLSGVLHDVNAQTVSFDFHGTSVPAPRSKVEGILYYHSAGRDLPDPICRLTDGDGSIWHVQSLEISGQLVEFVTVVGAKTSVPLARLAKLDFSAANIEFLDDLEPALVQWRPFFPFGSGLSQRAPSYESKMGRVFDRQKLKLYSEQGFGSGKPSEREFARGIALHSQTTLEYILSGKYKRFMATVGIDTSVRRSGHVRLTISGDREVLLDVEISGADKEPLDLDLEMNGIRRLTIVVDFGNNSDFGDHLNLCNARLTK